MLLLIILSLPIYWQIPTRHPAQLYEALLYLFSYFFSCIGKQKQGKNQDYCLDFFLVLLFSVRIVVESVKESQGGFERCCPAFFLLGSG
jgi:prolipoprotein diacylglyceryltransferase